MSKARSELIHIAAKLLHGVPGLSSYAEDMPATTPKIVLRRIGDAEEFLRLTAIEIKAIADKLKPEGGSDE